MQAVRGTHRNTSQRTKVSGWHEAKDAEDAEETEETLTERSCIAKTADTKNTPINDCQLTSQQIHCDTRFMCQLASQCVSDLFTSYSARMHNQTHSRAEQSRAEAVFSRRHVVMFCFDLSQFD